MKNDAKTTVPPTVAQIKENLYSTHCNALGHLNPASRSPHGCRHLADPAGHVSPCPIPVTSKGNGLTSEACGNEVHEQKLRVLKKVLEESTE